MRQKSTRFWEASTTILFGAVLAALCAVAIGCQHGAISATKPAERQKSTAELDREVLDTVLADLLVLNDKDSPVALRGKAPENIHFAMEAATYPIRVEAVLNQQDPKLWAALSSEDMIAAREAAQSLVSRHDARESFEPFTSHDPRVVIATTRPAMQLSEMYARPIEAWSPGYSADRRFAVVQLSIPWSMHHANGTFLLRWDDGSGKWIVVLRQFVYFV